MRIVINNCFGGFNLSNKAFELYLKKKNIRWVEKNDYGCYYTIPVIEYERISKECYKRDGDYRNVNGKGYIISSRDIERNDPILIEVIEELGDEANGRCAELKIVEIPDGVNWEIDEYDGVEKIDEVHRSWN